jgi:hypothetical protein
MMKLVVVLALLALFTACNREERYELPFENHPGVLKGAWTGSISNYPILGDTTPTLLRELRPLCKESGGNGQCALYEFTGTIQLGNSTPVAITGEGQVPGVLYFGVLRPQLSPPPPPQARASFTENGVQYNLEVAYWNYEYTGQITVSGQTTSYDLVLKP